MLQICDGVKWTAVCDYQWRQEYSIALCQDLGHTNPSMPSLSPLTLLIAFLSLFVAPLSVPNNGSWSTISYVSRYSSYYSTPSCHYSNESIVACLTNSSYYVTSYYARYRYCNTARDTLYIQCDFDMGKYFFYMQMLLCCAGTCTRGSIRLYNNGTSSSTTNSSSGMLQMCDNSGRWTAVCGYRWRCTAAKVACKQLGYTSNSKCTNI